MTSQETHEQEQLDIEDNFENNWREILMCDSNSDSAQFDMVNITQLKKELHDYSNLMDRMSELTDYISNGLLSKPNYTINVLKNQVDDGIRKGQEEFRKDIVGLLKSHNVDKKIIHEINGL